VLIIARKVSEWASRYLATPSVQSLPQVFLLHLKSHHPGHSSFFNDKLLRLHKAPRFFRGLSSSLYLHVNTCHLVTVCLGFWIISCQWVSSEPFCWGPIMQEPTRASLPIRSFDWSSTQIYVYTKDINYLRRCRQKCLEKVMKWKSLLRWPLLVYLSVNSIQRSKNGHTSIALLDKLADGISNVKASFHRGLSEFFLAVVFFFFCLRPPPSKYTLTKGSEIRYDSESIIATNKPFLAPWKCVSWFLTRLTNGFFALQRMKIPCVEQHNSQPFSGW